MLSFIEQFMVLIYLVILKNRIKYDNCKKLI